MDWGSTTSLHGQKQQHPVSRSVTQLSRWVRKGRGQEGLRKASAGAKGDSKGVPKKAAGEEDRQAAFGCMTPRRRLTCIDGFASMRAFDRLLSRQKPLGFEEFFKDPIQIFP